MIKLVKFVRKEELIANSTSQRIIMSHFENYLYNSYFVICILTPSEYI
jgi:hypothetical protein